VRIRIWLKLDGLARTGTAHILPRHAAPLTTNVSPFRVHRDPIEFQLQNPISIRSRHDSCLIERAAVVIAFESLQVVIAESLPLALADLGIVVQKTLGMR
jgi:hypothetical protein